MKKKALNGKTWIIISVVVVLLAVLGVVGYTIGRSGSDRTENLLELGQRYLDKLEYEQAIACFEEYLEIDPKSVEAYVGLAQAYVGLEKYEKALEVLAEGYVVTGDGSLQEMSSRIKEQYREWLLAEGGTDAAGGADGDRKQGQGSGTRESTKPLVLDATNTSIVVGNGGVIITLENQLYGAINYYGEEIVPHVYPNYANIPTEEGYFALSDEAGTYVFDSQGEMVYEITEAYGQLYISGGVVLYSLLDSEEGEVCWYDLTAKKQNSVALVSGVSITQMQNGKFNAWRSLLPDDGWQEDIDMAFWTVDKDGSVEKNEDAVWGFDSYDYSYIRPKADGYIPMYIWGRYGLLSETGESVVWSDELGAAKLGVELEFFMDLYLAGYYRDGSVLYNRGMQVVVMTDNSANPYFLLDLSKAVTAPAVQEQHGDGWSTMGQPAGRITNMEDVLLAYYDFIQLSDSGLYLASDGESWFYLDEKGQKVDQTFLDCSAFYNGCAIVIDTDGMAYLIDTEFNKVSEGYPADSIYTAEAIYCIVYGDHVTILTAPEE